MMCRCCRSRRWRAVGEWQEHRAGTLEVGVRAQLRYRALAWPLAALLALLCLFLLS